MKPSRMRTFVVWGVLIGLFAFVLTLRDKEPTPRAVSFDVFRDVVAQKDLQAYSFARSGVRFQRASDGEWLFAPANWNADIWTKELAKEVRDTGAEYIDEKSADERRSRWLLILLILAPLIVILILLLRRCGGGMQNIFALRSSRARLVDEASKVRFDDIGGCGEAKRELADLVSFLKDPRRWTDAGARLPRGILLEGPPGCGKTLLARAVAGETNAKFYHTSASEFVEMFIGVGPARVRDMFETARKEAPSVLFIDELDAIGRRRGSGVGFANEEREQTLNQILVSMDGFERNDSVVVIAATNRADILDKALVRAGRFDRRVTIEPLDAQQRATVLEIHTRDKAVSESVDLMQIAEQTDGLTGADLETLANRAALLAVRRCEAGDASTEIETTDFQTALKMREDQDRSFDALDAVLLEATTQLAEPVARAVVRITLVNDRTVEGEVLWIDPNFVKVHLNGEAETCIIPKTQICQMQALKGTAAVKAEDLQVDRSLNSSQNFA